MVRLRFAIAIAAFLSFCCADSGVAATVSYTGTLATPENIFTQVITVPVAGTVTLQTWGFGGGTNAAGTVIGAGGFDPLVGFFSGTGAGAQIVDATSDILTNYGSYTGCPPAGTVTIGAFAGNCGDVTMKFAVAPGMYTVILADGDYIPQAVYDNGTLGEGYVDFTGGSFQTCVMRRIATTIRRIGRSTLQYRTRRRRSRQPWRWQGSR